MRKKLRIMLDFDDVLAPCSEYAVKLANNDGIDIRYEDITAWGKTGTKTDAIFKYFKKKEFFENQPLYPGAVEFVKELQKIAEVFVLTAINPEFMTVRANKIIKNFPIDTDHILMGQRKDLVDMDILWDDKPDNILSCKAAYPVVCRRPWNQDLTGLLATNDYNEFLRIVKEIIHLGESKEIKGPMPIALVGPSGSGKTLLCDSLDVRFSKLISTTTREKRPDDKPNAYHYVSKDEFRAMLNRNEFFEHTVYAGEYYGTKISDLQNILSSGKNAVIAIDIAGAMTLKNSFNNCITIYIDRPKRDLLATIMNRNISNEDKIKRIVSLDSEERNQDICDFVIRNDKTIENLLDQFYKIFS